MDGPNLLMIPFYEVAITAFVDWIHLAGVPELIEKLWIRQKSKTSVTMSND